MIGLRRNCNSTNVQAKQSRSSMLVTGSTCENVIQLSFGAECFKGKDVRNIDSKDSMTVYNFLCSLFAFSLYEFNELTASKNGDTSTLKKSERRLRSQTPNILVLIDATKIPLKALRIILRACQSALAYKIRQAIIVEPEGFLGQQRVGIDILLDSYDFKTVICPKSKLWKYMNIGTVFYDLTETRKIENPISFAGNNEWVNIRQKFYNFFVNSPKQMGATLCQQSVCTTGLVLTTSSASLAKFLRKDNIIVIELVENDLDAISIRNSFIEKDQGCKSLNDSTILTNNSQKFRPNAFNIKSLDKCKQTSLDHCDWFSHNEKSSDSNSRTSLDENNKQSLSSHHQIHSRSKHPCAFFFDQKSSRLSIDKQLINMPPAEYFAKTKLLPQNNDKKHKFNENNEVNAQKVDQNNIDIQKVELNFEIIKRVDEQIRLAEKMLKWIDEIGNPTFNEIDAQSLLFEEPCCSLDDENEDGALEVGNNFEGRLYLNCKELLQTTESMIDKCAAINETQENLTLKIREVNGNECDLEVVKSKTVKLIQTKENYSITIQGKMLLMTELTNKLTKSLYDFRTQLNNQKLKIDNYKRFRRAVAQVKMA